MIIFIFHTHIVLIFMIIILHRSELQSLANQTAYNVSQLLDNLLQVTIFQPCSDVMLDFIPQEANGIRIEL